jgi:hypothetical protein
VLLRAGVLLQHYFTILYCVVLRAQISLVIAQNISRLIVKMSFLGRDIAKQRKKALNFFFTKKATEVALI